MHTQTYIQIKCGASDSIGLSQCFIGKYDAHRQDQEMISIENWIFLFNLMCRVSDL